MQNNTEKNRNKRIAPVVCAAVIIVLLAAVLAALILPVISGSLENAALVLFLGVYALVIAAVIVGVVLALMQRLREIRGGEEEDAKKY